MMRIAKVSTVFFLFVACSMDEGGVQPNNRRPCPTCNENETVPEDPCQGVTYEGQCTEDGVVQWCEDGELWEINCVAQGDTCGYDEEVGFYDCLLSDEPQQSQKSSLQFTCTCGQILLDVQFALGEDGCIKGMLGYVKLEQVVRVKFFMDQTDITDAPSSVYELETNSALLELPACSITGNLFLTLRDGSQAWADIGSLDLAGASVSGDYLVAFCGQGSECYCQ